MTRRPEGGGAELIAAERARQVDAEGWTADHDDEHTKHELVRAALCYITPGRFIDTPGLAAPKDWPWEACHWKPKASSGGPEALGVQSPADRIRNLTKAGALLAAEIDRLQRAALKATREGAGDDKAA